MAALDARITLALMAKAQRTFGNARKTLAFPLLPIVFSPDQLDFSVAGKTAEGIRAAVRGLAEFSRLANLLPNGALWGDFTSGTDLARVYRSIFETARVAQGELSAADRADLQAAEAVLYVAAAGGGKTRTALYESYFEYRDRWFMLNQRYRTEKLSAEMGNEPAALLQWQQVTEPALREEIRRAERDWSELGGRARIEEALARIAVLSTRPSLSKWNDWDFKSRPGGLFVQRDENQENFWPAYLMPANAASAGWQKLTVSAAEAHTLAAEAPPEIRSRLGQSTGNFWIKKLELEFSTAGVLRPWFDPAVFAARFWRPAAADAPVISEGTPDHRGLCARYATGVVFCRNVRATIDRRELGALYASLRLSLETDGGSETDFFQFMLPKKLGAGKAPLSENFLLRPVEPDLPGPAPKKIVLPFPPRPGPPSVRQLDEEDIRELMARLRANSPPPAVHPPTAAPDLTEVVTNPEAIFVLAFICADVPKCPDPDPGLDWGNY